MPEAEGEVDNRGFFERQFFNDDRGYGRGGSFRWGKAVGLGLTGLAGAFVLASSIYRNEPREVTLEINIGGEIVEQVSEVGLHLKTPWPFSRIIQYSTAMNITPTESENVRMGDELRMAYSGFECQWNINPDADYTRLYEDLRGSGEDITTIAQATQLDALTRAAETLGIEDLIEVVEADADAETPAVEGEEPVVDVGFVSTLSTRLETLLADSYEDQGWPITVSKCLSRSYRFDQDTETRLARLAGIRQERVELEYRDDNAIRAQDVYANEAIADAAYVRPLIEAGMSPESAASALCVFKAATEGNLAEPLTPGCFGGGQQIAVTVPMPGEEGQALPEPVAE